MLADRVRMGAGGKKTYWQEIQGLVRSNYHLTEFALGDVFTCDYGGNDLHLMVIGMNLETPTNPKHVNSMTLHTVDCLPDHFQFDSPESDGHYDRTGFGNNRWMWSNIRQWLNSQAASFQWTSTHQYDTAPSLGFLSGYSGGGFLNLLDPELVAVLGSVEKKTARCVYDGSGQQDPTDEMAFLLSQHEAGLGAADAGNVGGEITYPWYITNARRVKKVGASNSAWWLRSPFVAYTTRVRQVSSTGALSYSNANLTRGLAPAIVII